MEGETLQKITAIYLQQGQYGPVLEFAQQALVLARQLPGEGPGTALQQEALQSLGQAYQSLGQYQKAVDHYEESLILARALGDQLAQKLLLKYLSVCYAFLGLPAQASKARQDSARLPDFEALVPHKLTGGSPQDTATPPNTLPNITPAGQVPSSPLAATPESPRRDLAVITDPSSPQVANPAGTEDTQAITRSILVGTSEDTQAITRSLKMLVPQNENYLIKAVDLLSEGAAYARQQQWERAENAYREALAMAQTHGNLQLQSLGWFYLGLLYKTQGQSAQALEAYQQRVNIAKMLQTPAEVASTLYLMGDLQARLGILEQANATLRQSLSFFETLRVGLRDSNNVSLFDTQRGAYQRLQEVLVALHQPEAALEVAERGRARAYAELLSVRSQGVPTLDALTLSQIQQTARTQQATLVVYSLVGSQQPSHEQLLIWVIQSSGAVTLRSVHLEAGGLKKRVKQLRDLLTQAEITRLINAKETTKDLTIFSESLAALYQVLIQPIADLLPRHPLDRLIFLPQGDLFLVPFAALADQTGQPLLERHTILSAPSIQVVNLIKKPLQRNQSGRTASSGLLQPALIVGNPVQDLPAAAAEAQAIARLLHTPALIGKQATRAVILQQMPSKRLIHLATHGSFEPLRGTGLPGFITLAPSGHDDGFLTSNDIMDLRLKAELVVLSACDTGRGTITGDGVIGLSRAFFAAGASSLVASLWSVPDDSTGLLMDQFYQALGQHPDKARALRQAMLFTRSRYPLPSHWAAFTLMGDAL
jgi:CHAT domain-containing protein/Tfp pilus assembly protein PilF